MPLEPFPARSARHLPHAGKALSVVILLSTYACIRSDNARQAAFSYRSLPQWGRGTAQRRSGALVNDALETISPDLFHPASAHPTSAPSGHLLPMEGGSVHAPLPMEGAAERSEAGLASFWGGEAASSLPSPLRKEGCVTALGCSYIACLRRSPTLFHTASALSGSLRSPPSPRGEGFVRRYSFSTYACIRSDNARKAAFSYRRSLPPWGRGTAQRWIGYSRISST